MGDGDRPPRRGRPRSAELDTAIEVATRALLAERGYAGLTFTAVAERAGTTPPALYRRFSSKADLVLEVVFRTEGDDVVADTGDLEADVRSMVRWALEKYASPEGRAAMAGLLAEPVVADQRPVPLATAWRRTADRFARAVERGELPSGTDPAAAIVAMTGPALLAAALHGEAAVSDAWVERISSVALDGLRGERVAAREAS